MPNALPPPFLPSGRPPCRRPPLRRTPRFDPGGSGYGSDIGGRGMERAGPESKAGPAHHRGTGDDRGFRARPAQGRSE